MAVKNFDRALYSFEVALTTPSSAVSHIMLESYKKYILVSLILHGKASLKKKVSCNVFTCCLNGYYIGGAPSQVHIASGQSSSKAYERHLPRNNHGFCHQQAEFAGTGAAKASRGVATRKQLGFGQTSTTITLQEDYSAADSDLPDSLAQWYGPPSSATQRDRSGKTRLDYGI